MRVPVALCLAALQSLWTLAWPAGAAVAPYADRVVERVLDNGLEVLVLEDHKAPVAVLQLWYRVGSRNESSGHTGLSHLFEHLMFRGTETVAPEEYSRIIQRNGGRTNAFTSRDGTTYFATIASDRVEIFLELEADRMVNLLLTDAQVQPELAVVQEERRLRTDNNPPAALFEQLFATAYTAHPYQHPVIGWMADIRNTTVEDLRRHYRTYYAPNNAVLIAVGDVEAASFLAAVERHFGAIPRGPEVPEVQSVEPPQQGERRLVLRKPAELPYVALGHHAPNLHHPDAAALDVLAQVLAGGRSARLHRELVYRQRLARHASASYDYSSVDPSLFVLSAQPLPDRTPEEVEAALLAEVARLADTPPTERELQKARNAIAAHFVFSQDSLFYQGMLLGGFELADDWRHIDRYLAAVERVSAADVARVADTYLRADNRTTAHLLPGEAAVVDVTAAAP